MTAAEPILVALGSNIEPEANLVAAAAELAASVEVVAVSSVWESAPVGAPGTPPFLNAVVRVRTAMGPRTLKFGLLRPLERRLGRRRSRDRNAPRPIDLDLVLYGDRRCSAPDLTLPDPDLTTRAHVAVPAAEVAPEASVPGSADPLAVVAAALDHALHRRDDVRLDR